MILIHSIDNIIFMRSEQQEVASSLDDLVKRYVLQKVGDEPYENSRTWHRGKILGVL